MPPFRRVYNSFDKRLESFSKINLIHRFKKLPSSGFRYNAAQNCAKCHCCYTRDYNFLSNRDSNIFRAKSSSNCMFLRRKACNLWIYNATSNYSADYDEELFICKMYYVNKIYCIFKPCGHAVWCRACFFQVNNCPYCRTVINACKPIYY